MKMRGFLGQGEGGIVCCVRTESIVSSVVGWAVSWFPFIYSFIFTLHEALCSTRCRLNCWETQALLNGVGAISSPRVRWTMNMRQLLM